MNLRDFIKKTKVIRLNENEKIVIKQSLLNFISSNPVRPDIQPRLGYGSNIFLTKLSFVPSMAILLIFTIMIGGGVAVGAEKALPGDTLYPVKVSINEEVRGWLAHSEEAKADWEIRRTERRLEEAEELADEGSLNAEASERIEANFEAHAEKVKERIQKFENKDNFKAAVDVSSKFETSLRAHNKILNRLSAEAEADAHAEADVKNEVKPIQARVRTEAVNAIRTRKKVESREQESGGVKAIGDPMGAFKDEEDYDDDQLELELELEQDLDIDLEL